MRSASDRASCPPASASTQRGLIQETCAADARSQVFSVFVGRRDFSSAERHAGLRNRRRPRDHDHGAAGRNRRRAVHRHARVARRPAAALTSLLTAGTLPAGLTGNAATGEISGTPDPDVRGRCDGPDLSGDRLRHPGPDGHAGGGRAHGQPGDTRYHDGDAAERHAHRGLQRAGASLGRRLALLLRRHERDAAEPDCSSIPTPARSRARPTRSRPRTSRSRLPIPARARARRRRTSASQSPTSRSAATTRSRMRHSCRETAHTRPQSARAGIPTPSSSRTRTTTRFTSLRYRHGDGRHQCGQINGSPLDSVIEIVDENGVAAQRPAAPRLHLELCRNDDEDFDAGLLDSRLVSPDRTPAGRSSTSTSWTAAAMPGPTSSTTSSSAE